MHRYIPSTKEDRKEMLEEIGANSIDDLFKDIPNSLRLDRDLKIEDSLSELEIKNKLKKLGDKNQTIDELTCFLGAGMYDHYIPSVIGHLATRGEFLTSYTPYQAEISQGTLRVIFEYQTLISNLTGMDVSNASMYDGPTACAEAALVATDVTRKKKIIISKTVHPEVRKVVETYMKFRDIDIVEVDMKDGVTDAEKLKEIADDSTAGVIVQNPNFFGIIENLKEIEEITHKTKKAKLITYVDPISLAILKSPGEIGADIVVGEGQSLGNKLNFGGPTLGFLAVKDKLARKIPGRIVGETVDEDDNRAFVLTLQAREQHIRRFKATSNICSNQGLNALMSTIYLVTMGKQGLKEVATQSLQKAHYAFDEITKSGKFKPVFDKPFFKEFAVQSDMDVEEVNSKLLENKILGGYNLTKDYKDINNSLLFAVTEKRTKEEIDKLVSTLEVL
ncbi:MAG: aminomethyl-transferring glycine dehydrogenase subunit GcvPA [Senegalia sp. (in: firmicutes)]|uniref:aminomethyl-transferring glycine dehydrogenase subunit GcvPA n=1 Tax=Senegalia sp. (in: firmicutes) TaxID=1924098 RepID=UPI003F973EBF